MTTGIQALPLELKHCVFTFLDAEDVARLRLVNKEALQQVDDSVYLPHYVTLTSGSRWYQCNYRCYWCDDSIPFNSELCKRFKSCLSCLDDVVKTCHNCQKYPVSVLEMNMCEHCECVWCIGCVNQMLRLYVHSSCELKDFWVCFHCMLSENLLRVCEHDACDQLLCACVSCSADRLHSDSCLLQYCSESCANDCACASTSSSEGVLSDLSDLSDG